MVDLSAKGFRSSEPGGIDREMSALLKGVLDLARADGLRLTHVARELGLPLSDIEQALAGLAVIPLSGGGADLTFGYPQVPDLRVVEN